jgi:hypothetical protein
MTYLPKLFIREIGNATSSQIYRVIEDLGFGRVTRISFRGNNAIAFVDWDIPNTQATRILLEEGTRLLSLYHSDDRCWKVSAYKTREEQERERFAKQEQIFLKKDQEYQERKEPEPKPEPKPTLSWAAQKIQEAKARIEKEKQQNADPNQAEYDKLRAALLEINAKCRQNNAEEFRQMKEKMEKERIEQEKQEQEQEKFIQELALSFEQAMQELSLEETPQEYDSEESSEESVAITPLDYGRVAEFYPIARDIIRARIRNA